MENIKEKTISEIMEDLEIDLVEKANERIDKEMLKYPRHYRKSTRCDAYGHIDDILFEELRKSIKDITLQPNEKLELELRARDDKNRKNRYIQLIYKFENQTIILATLSLDVTVKKVRLDVFKVNSIERDGLYCEDGVFYNKTLTEAIEYARELANNKLAKMREEELPEFIDKTEQKFAEIIEAMRRGEDIESPWFYERIYNRYFELRGI